MINQDKVKLMAKIQHFENTEQSAMKANGMYQRDYLAFYLIRSFCAYIILLCIVGACFFLYNWETLLTETSLDTLIVGGKGLLSGLGLLLIPVMVISYIIYWFRYRKSMKKMRTYMDNLKKLDDFYDQEAEQTDWLK